MGQPELAMSHVRSLSPNQLGRLPDGQDFRSPAKIMRSARLGCFHQTRLSFSRSLLRRAHKEGWRLECSRFEIDASNVGEAHYTVHCPGKAYTFIAFAHSILPSQRTDRAIARHWDYTFVLCDGRLSPADLERLRINVPLQDEGRYHAKDIVFSRANKSARLFDAVVASLASSRQPNLRDILDVGYLIRTTAVFANGKFGIADYDDLRLEQGGLGQCFEAQMLIVYLIREFSLDLVDYLARHLNPSTALGLNRDAQRLIGVGNATGLGMAPFIVDHPILFNSWIATREAALNRVVTRLPVSEETAQRLLVLLDNAIRHLGEWRTDDPRQSERNRIAARELEELRATLGRASVHPALWRQILAYGDSSDAETEEILVSILVELGADLVDDLEARLSSDQRETVQPELTLADIWNEIHESYAWCLQYDFSDPEQEHFFWYRSAFKSEPRLGIRGKDDGADLEMFIGVAREVSRLHAFLSRMDEGVKKATSVGRHLLSHPEHRTIVCRISNLRALDFGEVHENLLAHDIMPIDLLRCKLAFFGATRFDPKSDRWVRVVLFYGAPRFDALGKDGVDADNWLFACGSP